MKKKDIKILLVDDEPDILEIVSYNLSLQGYQIITGENGVEAVEKAKKHKPHLIILDVMMPQMDGIEACEKIRELPDQSDTIITFLTARGEDYSQVAGFDAGADDYISKPVKPKILMNKIATIVKRLNKQTDLKEELNLEEIKINRKEYTVYKDGNSINLPRKEFELFYLLASEPGKVFTRDEIMSKVWGLDVIVGDRTIDVHIRKLREKVGDLYFKTVKGVGYKFSQK